jgi:diacylglycerol kinase family enzyme
MPPIALLANPDSGTGDAEHVADLLRASGAEVTVFGLDEWRDASASGSERIVVAGGDGSLGSAAEAAALAGVPLAVVPTGTANDFAAEIGLPAEVEEACELAVGGQRTRRLELARAGDRPFLNVASVGLAPAAAEEADGLKGRMGALAYPLGAVKAGATARPIRCEVRCDGGVLHEGEAWQVSVASTGAFGGGAALEADATDGKLDLVVIEGSSRARLVKHAFGLRMGTVEGQAGVLDSRCSAVELRLADDGDCLNIDGELVEAEELAEDGAIRFTVEPAAFDLIVA